MIADVEEMERAREGLVVLLVGCGHNEGIDEERKRFWNDLDMNVDRVVYGYRFCVQGNLNGWIGDRVRAGITVASGVSGENENGRRVVEFCVERGLCVGNTYLEHKSLHKYTRVARAQDGVEVKNMIDLVLMKKDMLRFV